MNRTRRNFTHGRNFTQRRKYGKTPYKANRSITYQKRQQQKYMARQLPQIYGEAVRQIEHFEEEYGDLQIPETQEEYEEFMRRLYPDMNTWQLPDITNIPLYHIPNSQRAPWRADYSTTRKSLISILFITLYVLRFMQVKNLIPKSNVRDIFRAIKRPNTYNRIVTKNYSRYSR